MKRHILSLAAAALLLASCGQKAPQLENRQDTISWVVGQSMAESLMAADFDLDNEVVMQAIEATLNNKEKPFDQETYTGILSYLSAMAEMNQHQKMKAQASQAQEKQNAYFQKLDKEKPQLLRTPSGIRYELLKQGKGPKAKMGDVAVFHYRAFTAEDGRMFDQTYGNRDAIVHVVGQPMMPAMIEALTMVNAGSTIRVYLPYEATSGVSGMPGPVPVIYELELVKLNPNDNFTPQE